ncbi:phosphotransferase-like protein [Niveomyces insectorum RCEF 264]|uniref:Phosphotransferase-like protein n=1 Tax=Niveomyces insectorum RCEF 264 TaxID=1081102 RepID=A0A167W6P7_9HYPO|nr:phosphotransferase-like protein [Niveomyces insectorum RCEF 264]
MPPTQTVPKASDKSDESDTSDLSSEASIQELKKALRASRAEAKQARADAKKARADAKKAKADAEQAQADAEQAQADAEQAKKLLRKTTFSRFLDICHENVFLQLKIQKNTNLVTVGGMTRVDGKLYPRRLRLWTAFESLRQDAFARLQSAFQQQTLFPSTAGLDYLVTKLAGRQLASEEDLKNFECLAVEGCALDVLPHFIELVSTGAAAFPTGVSSTPGSDDAAAAAVTAISFNNYPFGVVAADSDLVPSEPDDGGSRGRSRSRSSIRTRSTGRRKARQPLIVREDRPAYIGALAVAKDDMDAAAKWAAEAAEERDASGPPKKKQSPDRTKVHPDQWCFRHGADGAMRPVFVIEYKAAHKISPEMLRSALQPEQAASLMEEAIRTVASEITADDDVADRLNVARVLTQTYYYMIDYGLQYSYATTGETFVFLFLDPDDPSTLHYHLEEPKTAVKKDGVDLHRSAVALVLSFVTMAMAGQHMTQAWKKNVLKTQPAWPKPYKDMEPGTPKDKGTLPGAAMVVLAPGAGAAAACEDPQKQKGARWRDQDDDSESGDGGAGGDGSYRASSWTRQAGKTGTDTKRGTRRDSAMREASGAASGATTGTRQKAMAYCTQTCLLGLKTGSRLDPRCPNVERHRGGRDGTKNTTNERHAISADELRVLLVQQLAADLDHDCDNLERYGMYGAIGALFRLTLRTHGYCFLGKGVQRPHQERLAGEAAIYDQLEACQGRAVPVSLGMVALEEEYWTECGAHISHMLLLSFAGNSLWHYQQHWSGRPTAMAATATATTLTMDRRRINAEVEQTLRELASHGVEHGDAFDRNMVWNEEQQRIMAIDFDHAVVRQIDEARQAEKRRADKAEALWRVMAEEERRVKRVRADQDDQRRAVQAT